jgi:hypothetical protein
VDDLPHVLTSIPLDSRGGKLINWLKGNEPPLEGKIPMPKGDPRRLPDGSILPMPTSDPRNQIPDFTDDRIPMPMRDPRRLHNGKRIPFPMPDPRNEGKSWSPPPVDASAAAPAKVDVEVRPSSDLGINVKVEPSELVFHHIGRENGECNQAGQLDRIQSQRTRLIWSIIPRCRRGVVGQGGQ